MKQTFLKLSLFMISFFLTALFSHNALSRQDISESTEAVDFIELAGMYNNPKFTDFTSEELEQANLVLNALLVNEGDWWTDSSRPTVNKVMLGMIIHSVIIQIRNGFTVDGLIRSIESRRDTATSTE